MEHAGAISLSLSPVPTFAADRRRWPLRLPLTVLGLIAAGAGVACLLGLFHVVHDPHLAGNAAQSMLFYGAMFAYLRWGYVGVTRLTLDASGVSLRQPFAAWSVAWPEIATITVTNWLDVGMRGGTAAGVRLRLRSGASRRIPDVFTARRAELARLIASRAPSGVLIG